MKKKHKKIFLYLTAVLVFLIQTTIFQYIELASVIPNALIVFTSIIGFMNGKKDGMFLGFFCGFLIDVFYGDLLGYYALIYMLIGYFNGCFQRLFYDDEIKLPLVMVGISDLIYGLVVYCLSFLLRAKFDFSLYFTELILPEVIYTLFLAVISYPLIRKINQWIHTEGKRGVKHIV